VARGFTRKVAGIGEPSRVSGRVEHAAARKTLFASGGEFDVLQVLCATVRRHAALVKWNGWFGGSSRDDGEARVFMGDLNYPNMTPTALVLGADSI
jgi:hypothetical protein